MKTDLRCGVIVSCVVTLLITALAAGCKGGRGDTAEYYSFSAGGRVLQLRYGGKTSNGKPDTVTYAVYSLTRLRGVGIAAEHITFTLSEEPGNSIRLAHKEGGQYWIDGEGEVAVIEHGLKLEQLVKVGNLLGQDRLLRKVSNLDDLRQLVGD